MLENQSEVVILVKFPSSKNIYALQHNTEVAKFPFTNSSKAEASLGDLHVIYDNDNAVRMSSRFRNGTFTTRAGARTPLLALVVSWPYH